MQHWHPTSWQDKLNTQAIPYPSTAELEAVVNQLSNAASLVAVEDIARLKQQLAKASQGNGFIVQAGACAERFSDCDATKVTNTLNLLNQMCDQLYKGLVQPITGIGRIAGQYAKPRSQALETRQGESLYSYRGDAINQVDFTQQARTPDAARMLQAYQHAKKTVDQLIRSPNPCYTSHEALLLHYEQALTRQHSNGHWYNSATHFPWLGMRTGGDLAGAHVDYLRGIANPIGIKIGPTATPQWLIPLLAILNPNNEPGRITLITRLGAKQVQHCLPPLIQAVQNSKQVVLWMCDPMHGNSKTTLQGVKTRYLSDIYQELQTTTLIHQRLQSRLGGVHLEVSSDAITECVGGSISDTDLHQAYQSLVDPRLNRQQALELIQLFQLLLSKEHYRHEQLATNNDS